MGEATAPRLVVLSLRARFAPISRLSFPTSAAVPIRGALGFCLPPEIFRPHRDSGPSGLRDAPRPFVLRVRHLDSASIEPQASFEIGINLFAPSQLPLFQVALQQFAASGIGVRRVPLVLERIEIVDQSFDLTAYEPCKKVEVFFITPTQLKGWSNWFGPPFEHLMARIRDRISALCNLYGSGEPRLDFRGLVDRAREVRTVHSDLTQVHARRTSSRTGLTHPLSGFTGAVHYAGELSEFVPLLRAACCTGVGRQTVWGHGEIAIHP